jgi:putative adenylate-forming enzyme
MGRRRRSKMEFETRFLLIFYILSKYRFRFWSEKNIKKYQEKKTKEIARYAVEHSKFFKEHYHKYDINKFSSLPIVNKKIMMDNLTEYNTLGLNKDDLIHFALNVEKIRDFSTRFNGINIGMSSGTSGNKGIVITTKKEENYIKAMYASRLVLPIGEKLNCAFILRVSTPAFNYNRSGNKLTYINQLQPMEKIIEQLEKLNPNVVSAPPSMLKILATELAKRRLKISPKLLYSYAEVLYPEVKEYLEKNFKCKVHEVYQGSEGYYALTCRHGNLHINEDMVFFELLNDRGLPTKDGEPCHKLLVTDLHKKSQPIIRFELNDIITISKKKCSCGSNFRVIKQIQGRADDMFWGLRTDTKEPQFIFQDYISRTIISTSEDIEEYQATQVSYTDIILRIQLKKGSNKEKIKAQLIQKLKKVFSKHYCVEPEIKAIFCLPLLNKGSNKLIRIKCNIGKKNE